MFGKGQVEQDEVPEVAVAGRRSISIVWLIPLVAAAIAIWLAYTTLSEKGPTITITFKTAEGLEAGKTKVKYKDVEIGVVEGAKLSDDLSHIVVTASMDKSIEDHVTEGTQFWIVRPRIGISGVSGLSTLLSGVYVEMQPGEGAPSKSFTGLEEPPPIAADVPGTRYQLHADRLGSIGRGSAIYYRDVEVGQVLSYALADDQRGLDLQIFVSAPHDQLVRSDSRFWSASGIDVSVGANGVNVQMQSLQAVLAGGIAFDTPSIARPGEQAVAGADFPLYDSLASVGEAQFTEKVPYLVYFEGSVRGLRPGAPVEFRGIPVGKVTDVSLVLDPATDSIRIPVTLDIQPQRVLANKDTVKVEPYAVVAALVKQGLRAQLKSGNLLTGELFVSLDFHPEAPPAELDYKDKYPLIPSVPTQIEALTASVSGVLQEFASLPLKDLITELRQTVQGVNTLVASPETQGTVRGLNESAQSLQAILKSLDQQLRPTLTQAQSTLSAAQGLIGPDSQLRSDLNSTLRELSGAARSIRVFADYLARNPDALIRGKTGP
jgi:paraquat-inducible protein B